MKTDWTPEDDELIISGKLTDRDLGDRFGWYNRDIQDRRKELKKRARQAALAQEVRVGETVDQGRG